VAIDARMARDFGGAGVVKNLEDNSLGIADADKTFFTFDCNPTGSDQQYAANQQKCRIFARHNNITLYDISAGIGTHLAIDEGLAVPGSTLVSTDSHANILGAIGAFGQGMGDRDVAAAWSRGSVWFKVPETVKITLNGDRPENLSAKDIALNLLSRFGADGLLGYVAEIYGSEVDIFTLDERITISSMATEMGAIAVVFPPTAEVIEYCRSRSYLAFIPVFADPDAHYAQSHNLDISTFKPAVSLPGKPHEVAFLDSLEQIKVDSVFIGSCTNGRMEDMRKTARLLKGKKVAPGVVLKIVPSTDEIWINCLREGLMEIFKSAGALVGNAGCAGCASGQIGQNGPGEITVSTGNRNFEGKQGKGKVYLASVETAVASALAGYICAADCIPKVPTLFAPAHKSAGGHKAGKVHPTANKPMVIEGRVWVVEQDNIDTDMIYHNSHLAVTDVAEMGQYAFGNLKGWQDYPQKTHSGDIIIAGKNFGAGSSRQQAVDCFRALGTQAILAGSFGSIYERNAINAGFPVLTCSDKSPLDLSNGDTVTVDLEKGLITNKKNGKSVRTSRFSDIQKKIYQSGDLLKT